MPHYFAYGSNMSARRIRHRLGWAPSRISTILPDYQLTFDKKSNDGGKANVQFSSGNNVEGVLYFVKEEDLVVLDEYEGVADHQYVRHEIEVQDRTGHLMIGCSICCPQYRKRISSNERIPKFSS